MSIELGLPIEKLAIPEQIHSNQVKFIKFPQMIISGLWAN